MALVHAPKVGKLAGMPSPRLGPHPLNNQTSDLPHPPQMSMTPTMSMWPPTYYVSLSLSFLFLLCILRSVPHDQYNMYWYSPMPMQAHPQHQAPLQGQHLPHHPGMPMSPRNPSANLQPSTPTLPHTLPPPVHPPIPPPPLSHQSASLGGLAPSPSTPASAIPPTKTLNATSSSFVPRKPVAVSLKTPDGIALYLENRRTALTPNTSTTTSGQPGFRQGSPGTPNWRPASIRIESEPQRNLRIAEEEEQKEKEKAKLKAETEERQEKRKRPLNVS
jgi:translation initiation factor 4G